MIHTKSFRFDVKAATAGQFIGRASVYGNVDAHNDVVMPGAFTKTIANNKGRIKVLNQHNPMDPIGHATLEDSALALMTNGQLVLDLPSAKDAYTRLQHDLVDGISIGYTVADCDYGQNGIRQLKEIDLWEISLVTFPANDFARVTDVKSNRGPLTFDVKLIAEIARELKAGRTLSAVNRGKIQAAHESMKSSVTYLSEACDVIQALLDLTGEDSAKSKSVEQSVLKAKDHLTRLRKATSIEEQWAMIDALIDAVDEAADQFSIMIGADDPDEAAKAAETEVVGALSRLADDMRRSRTA